VIKCPQGPLALVPRRLRSVDESTGTLDSKAARLQCRYEGETSKFTWSMGRMKNGRKPGKTKGRAAKATEIDHGKALLL